MQPLCWSQLPGEFEDDIEIKYLMHVHSSLDPASVQPSSVAYVQGRSGEELGIELTKSLERYLKPGRSGKGTSCHASQDCGSMSLSSILHCS